MAKELKITNKVRNQGSLLAGIVIAGVGLYLLTSIHAASLIASAEAETGTISGNSAILSGDAGVSGTGAVKFGGGSIGDPVPNGVPGTWKLKFNDDFNGTSLDLTKWIMCNPSFGSSCNPWNNEQEKYNVSQTGNQNVVVSGGQLHLVTTKTGNQIYSGMVSTGPDKFGYNQPGYQSFQYTYGLYEGKVKFPKGNGFWPSMWELPDQDVYGGWPNSGEYDVVEIAGNNPSYAYFTAHWAGGSSECGHPCGGGESSIADASADFHTYALDWETTGITWYVDGKKVAEETRSGAIQNHPFYVIANFSVGGDWGPLQGAPDSSTPFPTSMDIDYLRVWQH
jgi:beta-glucanase (GH16 family)